LLADFVKSLADDKTALTDDPKSTADAKTALTDLKQFMLDGRARRAAMLQAHRQMEAEVAAARATIVVHR
jgi:hypothetical protein